MWVGMVVTIETILHGKSLSLEELGLCIKRDGAYWW